jgi:hypothetical protein
MALAVSLGHAGSLGPVGAVDLSVDWQIVVADREDPEQIMWLVNDRFSFLRWTVARKIVVNYKRMGLYAFNNNCQGDVFRRERIRVSEDILFRYRLPIKKCGV